MLRYFLSDAPAATLDAIEQDAQTTSSDDTASVCSKSDSQCDRIEHADRHVKFPYVVRKGDVVLMNGAVFYLPSFESATPVRTADNGAWVVRIQTLVEGKLVQLETLPYAEEAHLRVATRQLTSIMAAYVAESDSSDDSDNEVSVSVSQ
jgi:hypothetical protein